MKRLDVDFAPWGRARWLARLSLAQVLCLLVLSVAACALLWQVGLQQNELATWVQVQATQSERLQRLGRRHAPVPAASLPPERTLAANAVLRDLQAPWMPLLDRLETGAPSDVALLEFTPELRQRRLRLQAEAATLPGMTRYVAWLKTRQGFEQVVMGRHEVVESDPHQPVRFEIELQWAEVRP
jgi:hypothetical protein